jgi:predicted nucleotidyltransferase
MKITKKTSIEELGALVCQSLKDAGIEAFLSGGAVVTIYSNNKYESYDLDFVSFGDRNKIKSVMESLGFSREKSRHFVHPETPYFVEFPGTSMMIH